MSHNILTVFVGVVYGKIMENVYLSRGLFKLGMCGVAPISQTDLQDERVKNRFEFPAHPEYVKS